MGGGSSLSFPQILSQLPGFPLRVLLCARAGCRSWLMQLMVVWWGWRWAPYACNDLFIGVQTLCQLLIVLLKCLWAPGLGRG